MICILTTGRAGSSLLARILHEHGAWVGATIGGNERNPHGFYENRVVQNLRRGRFGSLRHPSPQVSMRRAEAWRRTVLEEIRRQGYAGGPWLIKEPAHFWDVWRIFDPVWLLPRRPLARVFESYRKAGMARWANDAELDHLLTDLAHRMDEVRDFHGGLDVKMPDVIAGDFSTLKPAVEAAGLTFNPTLTRSIIEPELWDRAS